MKKNILTKILVSTLIVLLVIALFVAGLIHLFGGRALKAGVEMAATKALDVPVTVEDISFSLLGGTVDMRNLVITNPPGYQHKNLLELGNMHIDIDIKSFMSDTVEIKEVKLDNMNVVIEQKGLSNNLNEVISALPSAEPAADKPSDEAVSEGKKLHINNLEIINVKVKVKLLPIPGRADTVEIDLAPIRMTDLGSDDKLDAAILTGKILTAIAAGIAQKGTDLLPKEITGPLKDTLQEQGAILIETGKEAVEKGKDIGKEVIEGGKDIGKGVTEALKGLFKDRKE